MVILKLALNKTKQNPDSRSEIRYKHYLLTCIKVRLVFCFLLFIGL